MVAAWEIPLLPLMFLQPEGDCGLFQTTTVGLPRTPWEGSLGRRVLQGAARPVHRPGSLLARLLSALLLGTSAPALTLNMASISPIRGYRLAQ
ncbi:hypothetical protein D7V93_17840 [Corallococcus llansteffanensis]|uniref:Uncharacterized protein n=1 Tax=Corallococcus llansteffanensis TaxID=2316731 RepID=A0A3A8PRY2_9BACT|nr:hypothetical protein D7V93_17840 [Corallococcus llansteffanensis]